LDLDGWHEPETLAAAGSCSHRKTETTYSNRTGTRRRIFKRKWPVPEGPAKFEQGGFTSRRRKDPKTLFPGASPGNLFGASSLRKLVAKQYRARRNIVVYPLHHQLELVLARLQKPQCYRWAAKIPRQLAAELIQLLPT
jgi:hypothetical protein